MTQMNTDASVLDREAGNFERIYEDLTRIITHVESTAGSLASGWQGQAGQAAQSALHRFHEAAGKQFKALNDISSTIRTAGGHYSSADEDHADSLAAAMNF